MLLILDLDETLIHATEKRLATPFDFVVGKYFVHKRPYLHDFLVSCAQHFELAVWSSASEDYVQEIVQNILPAGVSLSFVWGRNRCTPIISPQIDFYGRYNMDINSYYEYAKKLKKIKRRGYRLETTLIVDDTPAKLAFNYGNAIYIQPFEGEATDEELRKLMQYLPTLKDLPDVRYIEKRGWRTKY